MKQGNIMYVGKVSGNFGMSLGKYKSVKDFNSKMESQLIGLYKLGDYKNTRGPRPEPT